MDDTLASSGRPPAVPIRQARQRKMRSIVQYGLGWASDPPETPMLPDAAQHLWRALRKADRKAARERVVALKRRLPEASPEEIHRLLVQSKCLQAGAIGALTAMVDLVPGGGKVAGVVLGPLVDVATVTALQAELVIETFVLYEVELGEAGERFAILAIAATNVGATHASSIVARLLKRYAGALIGDFVLKRALPITNIATVATKNIALTYAIGMRAQAVARFRDADLDDWPKLMRQVTLIDESTLVDWATSAARTAIDQVQESARAWVSRVSSLLPDIRKLVPGAQQEAPEPSPQKPRAATRKPAARSAPHQPAESVPASPKAAARARRGMAAAAPEGSRKAPRRPRKAAE
jgi:hypothetical protein